jgi:hypothetical protein
MQASHQLMRGGAARQELFGGAGFVPNIGEAAVGEGDDVIITCCSIIVA